MFNNKKKIEEAEIKAVHNYKEKQLIKASAFIEAKLKSFEKQAIADTYLYVSGMVDMAEELGILNFDTCRAILNRADKIDEKNAKKKKQEKEDQRTFEREYAAAKTKEEKDKLLAEYRKKCGID